MSFHLSARGHVVVVVGPGVARFFASRCQLRLTPHPFGLLLAVSADEINRLRKRFMKLDRDGSGSIDRDEFLQIPQIANNPLASRMIDIFDEEFVDLSL